MIAFKSCVTILQMYHELGHQTPLGAVNNNGDIGVRGSDGSLRQGDNENVNHSADFKNLSVI